MKLEKKFYTTSDTTLAAYLLLKGMDAVEATIPEPDNPKRKAFVFHDDMRRPQFVEEFYSRDALVDAKTYSEAIQTVKLYLTNTFNPAKQNARDKIEQEAQL